MALFKQGNAARSIPEFLKAIAAAERRWGRGHRSVYQYKTNLAYAYIDDSQYDKAEPLFQEGLQWFMAAFKARQGQVTAKDVGTVANNYANYFQNVGQFSKALEMEKLALAYFESDGWNGPASMVHDNLGTTCRAMGEYDARTGLVRQGAEVSRRAVRPKRSARGDRAEQRRDGLLRSETVCRLRKNDAPQLGDQPGCSRPRW